MSSFLGQFVRCLVFLVYSIVLFYRFLGYGLIYLDIHGFISLHFPFLAGVLCTVLLAFFFTSFLCFLLIWDFSDSALRLFVWLSSENFWLASFTSLFRPFVYLSCLGSYYLVTFLSLFATFCLFVCPFSGSFMSFSGSFVSFIYLCTYSLCTFV